MLFFRHLMKLLFFRHLIESRETSNMSSSPPHTLGDSTLTLYVTPGHTPGSVSMLVPLKDGNQRHRGAELGGRDPGAEEEGVPVFPE